MLTKQQRKFAEGVLSGLNQAEAARVAGYSKETSNVKGSQLMKNENIKRYIQERKLAKEKKDKATEQVNQQANSEGKGMAFSDPMEYLAFVMNYDEDPKLKLEAAKTLMPYKHAKIGEQGKKETQQNKAKNAAGGIYATAKPPKSMVSLN